MDTINTVKHNPPSVLHVILLALALFAVTFAVNLQAPLYGEYAAQSGKSATGVTIAFAAYVAGLMPTLLFLGGISDRIGRRIPIAIALVLGACATSFLALFPSWETLVLARLLLGIGTGLATTAGTAYMTEIMGVDKTKQAALLVTSATSIGFGGGALATGISLGLQGQSFIPASFLALIIIAPIIVLFVPTLPRVYTPKLVSPLRLPVFPPKTWMYGVGMAIAWSTTGMTISTVPLELKSHGLAGWTGLVIFLSNFVGFLCQPFAKRMANHKALLLGFALVPLGFVVLLLGVLSDQLVLVLLGTAITSSASYGFTYLSALSEFSMRASDNRARAVAGLFVYAYIGFSFPVILSGAFADNFGLLPAMIGFSIAQIFLSGISVTIWKRGSREGNHE